MKQNNEDTKEGQMAKSDEEKFLREIQQVIEDVVTERYEQDQRWGESNHPVVGEYSDGSQMIRNSYGSHGFSSTAEGLREQCERRGNRGDLGWSDILVEQTAKAIKAGCDGDLVKAREKLVKLAAVAFAAIASIDRAKKPQ